MGHDVGEVDIDNVSLVAGHVGTENLNLADTGTDTGTDTGVDTGTDTGVDTWCDTGTAPVELVADGGFADGTGWSGNALNIVDGVSRADVGAAGNPWDVNLSGAVALTSGEDYTVTFTARGAEGRDLIVGIGDAGAPYHNHSETLSLTDGWQTYTLHLTALDATNGGDFTGASRVIFDMGSDVGQVDIDNVSVAAGHVGAEDLTGTPTADPTDQVTDTGTDTGVDTNEAPDFDHDSVFLQQNENIDTTQVIWNASATDADGDDVTYSLGGNDADAFEIDQNTGAVTFAESPDYESGVTSYDFTITASDGSLTDEQAVTVQINNVVEQYTLDPADLASGGEFVGEAMDDRMDGRGATSALELSGGAGTDVLYGGDAGDILDGGDGNDQLSGGGGDDVLIAGTGVDRIDGGDGIDTVVLDSEDGDFVSVNLSREWQYSGDGWNQIVNVENVVTGGGADIIKGNDIGNVVESGAGNDWVYANGGDDVLIGGEGIDRLFGGDGNDTVLYETDENLVIDLNSEWQLGNDGTSEGIDKLVDIENVTTGSGNDVLIGNDGANVLTGGDGDDTLTGGDGADVFRFYSSEGASTDVITDFTVGEDSIELIDDTTGEVAQAQITTDASGSTVTWDELTIVLDVTVNYDDINPITD